MAASIIFCVTPLALLRTVGRGIIAHFIVVVTFRIDGALHIAGVRIDAVEVGGAIGVGAFSLTVLVMTALRLGIHLIAHNASAVSIDWPDAHWTIRVLHFFIEHESPPSVTLGIFANCMLTICALHQACFPFRTALPESTAV